MITQEQAIDLVKKERERQDKKWGYPHHHHPMAWLSILMEEVGELAEAINENHFNNGSPDKIIKEATHVSAVALAMIEHFSDPPGPIKLPE